MVTAYGGVRCYFGWLNVLRGGVASPGGLDGLSILRLNSNSMGQAS